MNKPTDADLQAGIDAAAALTDTTEETPTEPITPTETTEEEVVVEETPAEEQVETTEETTEEEVIEEKPVVDYKEKFTESAREAQIREAKLKKTNEAIDQAAALEVTDEDAAKEYGDWDVMSDTEKRFAKDSLLNKKRFELIHQASQAGKDIQEWNEKVDTYIQDPKTLTAIPDLEGKTDEFKVFATKPTRRGSDFETLVSAFLFEVEQARPKHKGKMFETGTGGPTTAPKPADGKISVEESEKLRTTNYTKYKEYLKAGKIQENIA